MNLRKVIIENPILAIMRNVSKEELNRYVSILWEGGIHFFEVALNSKDACEEIRMLKNSYQQGAYIGAGTILSVEDAKRAVDAGADFLLSPSVSESVLEYCATNQIVMLPGAMTPSEVALCLSYQFTIIKMFPAGFLMPGYLKSIQGPLDNAEFIAIGGVTPSNARDFIKEGYLGVGMGSNLMPKEYFEGARETDAINKIRELKQEVSR